MRNLTSIEELHHYFLQSEGVSKDTREELRGKIYFALHGENFDGNEYVEEALDKGAYLCVTNRLDLQGSRHIFHSKDVLLTLQNLATFHRRYLDIPVLGITGSNGKTTTKELIACTLSGRFRLHVTQGNYNNLIGVPLTVLGASEETEFMVVEMGTNGPGEIDRLATIVEPNYGLITNIGEAHLEGLGSIEGVLHEKLGLFREVRRRNGLLFIPEHEDSLVYATRDYPHKVIFGLKNEASASPDGFFLQLVQKIPRLHVRGVSSKATFDIHSTLYGYHNALNLSAAAALGQYFGVPMDMLVRGLESYASDNNRSQILNFSFGHVMLDAYNANPVSMKAALQTLAQWPASSRIVLLGDMKELGPGSRQAHQDLVTFCESMDLHQAHFVGPEFSQATEAYRDVTTCVEELNFDSWPSEGLVVLVKGSRSMKMELVVKALTVHFQ